MLSPPVCSIIAGSDLFCVTIRVVVWQSDAIWWRRRYRGSGEGIQCGFPNRYADEILTDLGMSILNTYTPEIETCYTSACCSDHQSFYEQGYSATQYFERCGSIIDPQYHNAGGKPSPVLLASSSIEIARSCSRCRGVVAGERCERWRLASAGRCRGRWLTDCWTFQQTLFNGRAMI